MIIIIITITRGIQEKIYMTTYTRTTNEYKEMIEAIKKYKVERINTKEGSKIPVGSLESVVLAADAKAENPNASSIVLKLQYEDIKFLFTGDAPAELENNIREKYDIDVDVLKVAHHGSKNSCSILFLLTRQLGLSWYRRLSVGSYQLSSSQTESLFPCIQIV